MSEKKRRLLSAVTPATWGDTNTFAKLHEGRVGRKRLAVEDIQASNHVTALQACQERNARPRPFHGRR